jgi:hypothetical protein
MFTDAFEHVFFFIIKISFLRLWTATKLFISQDCNFSSSLNQVYSERCRYYHLSNVYLDNGIIITILDPPFFFFFERLIPNV